MASRYEIRVIDLQTRRPVAVWPPGGAVERDFVESVVANVQAKGVGWFKGEQAVMNAVRDALDRALYDLKTQVQP